MSIKATSPRTAAGGRPVPRAASRHLLRWPAPDTLALMLLLVIAIVCASLAGLALGTL